MRGAPPPLPDWADALAATLGREEEAAAEERGDCCCGLSLMAATTAVARRPAKRAARSGRLEPLVAARSAAGRGARALLLATMSARPQCTQCRAACCIVVCFAALQSLCAKVLCLLETT